MAINESTKIGEYFVLREFRDRRADRAVPDAAVVPLSRLCCVALDPIRRKFGVTTINSAYRTGTSNAAVGGASASKHLYGARPQTPAVDFRCATGSPQQWFDFLDKILGNSGGLGWYDGHCHVDRRTERARWTG